jgi:hypothetical protein
MAGVSGIRKGFVVVGLSGRLDKPDAASGLEDRIGTGLLAPSVEFVGST